MNWGRLFFGSLVVALGVLVLLDNANVLDAGAIIGDWWPVAVILAGVLSLAANPSRWAIPVLIALIGVALLLETAEILDLGAVLFPAIIIVIGLFIIFGRGIATRTDEAGDSIQSFNAFSGSELSSNSRDFRGGSVSAVFGGAEVDLRHAVLSPEAKLDVFAAFGAVEIRVPEGWRVAVKGLPLFGGIENATAKEPLPPDAPLLPVSATALFGGVEIKH
jgi:predicted membrane protein